jgi:hypothetical protein
MSLLELFCDVDDFCQEFEQKLAEKMLASDSKVGRKKTPGPKAGLCGSEVMTLLIHFHQSSYRNFKAYYTQYVSLMLRKEFPQLVSYQRFIELMPQCLLALCGYLRGCFGQCTGLSFVDSTSLKVCHNLRIHSHKVFEGLAQRAKNSMGWFFGFKLHFLCNDRGEILKAYFTPANVDDRKGLLHMIQGIFGKVFADRGYISQPLMLQLLNDFGIELFTGMKKNMHTTLPARYEDMFLLRKRTIIETITDQLKNISQLEHSRHRSVTNFMVNSLCALIAYCHQPKKPSLRWGQPFQLAA